MDENDNILATWTDAELFGHAIAQVEQDWETEDYPTSMWRMVSELRDNRATRQVFDVAAELCAADSWQARAIGAFVLAQFGVSSENGDGVFHEERFNVLSELLERESQLPQNAKPLANAISSLTHLHDPRSVELFLPFKNHSDEDVRWHVALGLSYTTDPRAVAALIELTRDDDSDVRDWATFGLGVQMDVDTPEVRDALFARLTDSDDDTRAEALAGLAKRKDERVYAPLIASLSSGEAWVAAFEAAEYLADKRLCPALLAAQQNASDEWRAHVRSVFNDAMQACQCLDNTDEHRTS